jgi:choline-sulfatase
VPDLRPGTRQPGHRPLRSRHRFWDNAYPYNGHPKSWGHYLIEQGHRVAAIGKLHYRADEDANGFAEKIETMNVLDGVGDRLGLLRHLGQERGAAKDLALSAGRGESTYTTYDRQVAAAASDWLRARAGDREAKPWVLFVGFVMPHLPLVAPAEFYDRYAAMPLDEPRLYADAARPRHPWIDYLTRVLPYDKYFDAERRRKALVAYHGMVSFLDHNIGTLLDTLDQSGLADRTRVIYTSDHGEMLGNHGIWGKCCMYEESLGIPLIVKGADVPAGAVNGTEVSLVDCCRTIVDAVGAAARPLDDDRVGGQSLFGLLGRLDETRIGFSEYHAAGAASGCFAVRRGRWKLVHYVGMPSQLFDLVGDPHEAQDLAAAPEYRPILEDLETALRRIVDPAAASARAFGDQQAKIQQFGGDRAIQQIGDFGHTPTPSEVPRFAQAEA